jgi:16S rRNA (cytidine1402-2'-O)-methyltransferase
VLVSTPIGNLGDISERARAVLAAADLVLCEDTRRTRRLCAALGIRARLASLHEHNEAARIPAILERLRQGRLLALVSDAGTPLISDPGYRLVRAALAEGLGVHAVPGPNAALTALVLSGLPPSPFLFLGFPPPQQGQRLRHFRAVRKAEEAGLSASLIWHEAPHRLAETLQDLAATFGEREAAVARELTKRFEDVRREKLPALAAYYAAYPARGEITIVVGPAAEARPSELETVDETLEEALKTQSLRDAVALVAAGTGRPRSEVYARALAIKGARKDVAPAGGAKSPEPKKPL